MQAAFAHCKYIPTTLGHMYGVTGFLKEPEAGNSGRPAPSWPLLVGSLGHHGGTDFQPTTPPNSGANIPDLPRFVGFLVPC
mmetsp:Transcript_89970/g.150378  ORF Transcript_89970/g.150378 Transcript_89970/m.150378 type:complete len:81 (-) Transcript_89970:22-264(-)